MSKRLIQELSRRERQIMDVVYQRGEISAAEIQAAIPDPPGYSAVRALLTLLIKKGHLRHRKDGRRYLYSPVVSRERVKRTMLGRVVETFFGNSVENVVATLIDMSATRMTEDELERLLRLINEHRREGGKK